VTFTRPTIGRKVYLSCGPSGHPETFKRCSADHELELYLGMVSVRIAVEGFLRKMVLAKKIEDWADVVSYLAELTHLEVDLVPTHVGVAFWAHIDQLRASNAHAAKLALAGGN